MKAINHGVVHCHGKILLSRNYDIYAFSTGAFGFIPVHNSPIEDGGKMFAPTFGL